MNAERVTVITGLFLCLAAAIALAALLADAYSPARTLFAHYRSPLTAAWIALLALFSLTPWLLWSRTAPMAATRIRRRRLAFGLLGVVLVVLGVCLLIALAVVADALGACLAFFLWVGGGAVLVLHAWLVARNVAAEARHLNDKSETAVEKSPHLSRCIGCLNGCVILLVLFFGGAVTIAAILFAADYNAMPPLGQIFEIEEDDYTLQMHMFCDGPLDSNSTIVFEHGGGANCLSMKFLQDQFVANGKRACIYDRVGYGWTPSTLKRKTLAQDKTGERLQKLLSVAGEKGPFVCVGHSAGASACVKFGLVEKNLLGIAMLDGYPDLITAGSFFPGQTPDPGFGANVGAIAFMAGSTGFTRGFVGNQGPDYVPQEFGHMNMALYGQPRFWYAQYVDVAASGRSTPEELYLYNRMDGSQNDETKLITYGQTMGQTQIFHFPAYSTVTHTNCTNPDDIWCEMSNGYKKIYREQTQLYVTTMSNNPGRVIVAPEDSGHNFPYVSPFAPWLAAQLQELFP